MTEKSKTRYSDEELNEFKVLIEGKLAKARQEWTIHQEQLADLADNDDAKVKGLDDGVGTSETETMSALAGRLEKYIKHLENALIRVNNKVYGICRETGQLISKDRLKVVPHATLSIHAKKAQK